MDVLLDEAGDPHLIGEGAIDAERLTIGERLEFREGADRGDAVAHHRDGFGAGTRRVYREDLSGDVDHRFRKPSDPCSYVLERNALRACAAPVEEAREAASVPAVNERRVDSMSASPALSDQHPAIRSEIL